MCIFFLGGTFFDSFFFVFFSQINAKQSIHNFRAYKKSPFPNYPHLSRNSLNQNIPGLFPDQLFTALIVDDTVSL